MGGASQTWNSEEGSQNAYRKFSGNNAWSPKFAGMPHSAILHATVDFILPPEGIARELRRIAQHRYVTARAEHESDPARPPPAPEDMSPILRLLRGATGVEFTHYKPSTISRRILRRMALRQLDSFGAYAADLRDHPEELDALYHDLLIKVTGFFRNPHAFEALKREVLPRLLEARPPDTPLRIWVPGCATGEEAYSLAISVLECLGEHAIQVPVRMFATDLDEGALAKARTGLYLENIELDVSPERLRRFFTKVDVHYQVNPAIPELCTFARHDLCRHPPFSHLDLVSCRNVLIYLDAVMQRRIMPLFHYALRPGGVLMLGTAETLGTSADLFTAVDHPHKLYTKVASALRPPMDFTLQAPGGRPPTRAHVARAATTRPGEAWTCSPRRIASSCRRMARQGCSLMSRWTSCSFAGTPATTCGRRRERQA